MHFAASRDHIVHDRLAEALGRIAIEEGHLRAVALLQEAVESGENHRAGDLIGINEVQRLGHGDEHLIVDAIRDVVQLQPFTPGILIAFLHVALAAQHRRHQTQTKGNLLGPGEHVVVAQNRRHTVEGGGDVGKVEAAVGARRLLLVEDHRVALPLQPVFDVQLLEQLAHVAVGAEENMQTGLIPVAVLVLPGGHLAAEYITGFHHHRGVTGVAEVLGTGQTSQTSTGNGDAHEQPQSGGNLKRPAPTTGPAAPSTWRTHWAGSRISGRTNRPALALPRVGTGGRWDRSSDAPARAAYQQHRTFRIAPSAATPMADTLIKSTTRHVRLFTARVENGQLVADASQLTLDLDPDNEFLWDASSQEAVQQRFRELVEAHAGADLTDYTLRRIGSELEGTIRQLLQAGQLRYNPDCRVLNYSMGLPQSPATA